MNWVATDIPWEEHCYHFALCVFLRYVKGEALIQACKIKRQNQASNKEWNCRLM
jgi:hypothetical protein